MEGLLLGHFSAIALGCSELDNVSSLLHKFSVPAPKLLPHGGIKFKAIIKVSCASEPTLVYLDTLA